MATVEPPQDVSFESQNASNVEGDANDITSPMEASPTKTTITDSNTNEENEKSTEPDTAEEQKSDENRSPTKAKASVTTEAKKAVKTVAGSVRAAPGAAVKKVSL